MEDRQYFTFLKSYADIYKQLPSDKKVAFMDAIIAHQLGDLDEEGVDFEDVLLNVAWSGIKHSLAKSKAQYLNGKKPKEKKKEAKPKPTRSQPKADTEQIRNKNKEIRNKKYKEKVKKESTPLQKPKETIDDFKPNEASLKAVKDEFGNCDINHLVVTFQDQARNRKESFKDLQAGFRNYIRRGFVTPRVQQQRPNSGLDVLKQAAQGGAI